MKGPDCVFVGGPIQHAMRPDGTFRPDLRRQLETIIESLRARHLRVLSAHVHEGFGQMDVATKFQEVCGRDYRWMQACDVFVAVLPLNVDGTVVFSAGTAVELGWASAMGKPIILVRDLNENYSHLINGLDVIACVTTVDIRRSDLAGAVCDAVDRMLEAGDHMHLAANR